jgi:hypothetical protein
VRYQARLLPRRDDLREFRVRLDSFVRFAASLLRQKTQALLKVAFHGVVRGKTNRDD